jgi:two-component system response regulator CpxR
MKQTETEKANAWPVQHILVVDDDVELCELVTEYLKPEGFEVTAAHDGARGVEQAVAGNFALIVLDVMLPGVKGFEALRRIRARSKIPVIMLTARGDDVDRILGLEIGADDYLPKPFNPRELAARIQAVLRRTTPSGEPTAELPGRIALGDVELDRATRGVKRGNLEVELTSVEFDLLALFLEGPGKVIAREDLVKNVLGRELAPFDRSIDVHVSNLRRKLGPARDGAERIKAIRGVGYVYVAPAASKAKVTS